MSIKTSLLLKAHRRVKKAEPWGILLAAISLFIAGWTFWAERQERERSRLIDAYTLLALSKSQGGLATDALEILYEKLGTLAGIDASGKSQDVVSKTNLRGVNLPKANLGRANFSNTEMAGAILTDTDLECTNFTNAYLQGVNFTGATLKYTIFIDADLTGAEGLTQPQLDAACGNTKTQESLVGIGTIRICTDAEDDWYSYAEQGCWTKESPSSD